MTQSPGESLSYLVLPAGPADAEALARVHVAAWRETYSGLLPDAFLARMSEDSHALRFRRELTRPRKGELTLAAVNRSGLFGYVTAGPSRAYAEGEAEISTLYLLRAAQGRGVGRRLLTDAARVLAAQGWRSLMISVLADNAHARGFYEHLGGRADPPRREPGPGGTMISEVSYRWADIGFLAT
jgi:ribosomal protein S18 acetylase RimI-like enzyme